MQKIINQLSEELSLPKEVIEKAYKAYWLFIKETIEKLPLKEDLSEEEFNKLKTNFNLPYLGKLSCTYSRWLGVREAAKIRLDKAYENKHKKGKTDV